MGLSKIKTILLQAQAPPSSSQTRTSKKRLKLMSSSWSNAGYAQGFLEYINNVLAGGLLSSLFSREEQSEIIAELVSPIRSSFC